MTLILPKRTQAALARDNNAATAIAQTAVHKMDSDDFLSPKDVEDQLAQLQDYLTERRVETPDYHLPQPSGWKIMMLVLTIAEQSSGGVIVVDDSREQKSLSSPQGIILAMGPAAYTDAERFSVGGELVKWHDVGDRITAIKYDASMFQLSNGQRLGFLNDTQPVSTIDKGWVVPC